MYDTYDTCVLKRGPVYNSSFDGDFIGWSGQKKEKIEFGCTRFLARTLFLIR